MGRSFLAAAACAFSIGCQLDSGDAERITALEDEAAFSSWELDRCQRMRRAVVRALAVLDGVSVGDEMAQKMIEDMIAVLRDDSAGPEHWLVEQQKLAKNPGTRKVAEEVRKAIADSL